MVGEGKWVRFLTRDAPCLLQVVDVQLLVGKGEWVRLAIFVFGIHRRDEAQSEANHSNYECCHETNFA